MKDIAVIFILWHISDEIIKHHFDLVGGINLDLLTLYMVFVVMSSQVAKFALAFWTFKDRYISKADEHWTRRLLGTVFPIHFVLFVQTLFKQREAIVEGELKQLSLVLGSGDEQGHDATCQGQFQRTLATLQETRLGLKRVREIHNKHQVGKKLNCVLKFEADLFSRTADRKYFGTSATGSGSAEFVPGQQASLFPQEPVRVPIAITVWH